MSTTTEQLESNIANILSTLRNPTAEADDLDEQADELEALASELRDEAAEVEAKAEERDTEGHTLLADTLRDHAGTLAETADEHDSRAETLREEAEALRENADPLDILSIDTEVRVNITITTGGPNIWLEVGADHYGVKSATLHAAWGSDRMSRELGGATLDGLEAAYGDAIQSALDEVGGARY